VGKLLGVKYIIMGGIDKFNIDSTKGGIGKFGVGGSLTQSNATINFRLVDTTTAERILSLSADGEVKKGGGFVKGTSLSREAEWGLASETIQKAAKAVVDKFTSGEYLARVAGAATPAGGIEGKIIKVEGNKAYINLGASSGIKMGDKFNVISVGEALIDPDTGAKLGASEKQTGNGAVVEVQDKFAVIEFSGAAVAKDTIRKQ
jgi:Curli production assembly/transport component CsgG/Flagellar assembly protein T, C-terminal domain